MSVEFADGNGDVRKAEGMAVGFGDSALVRWMTVLLVLENGVVRKADGMAVGLDDSALVRWITVLLALADDV